MSAEIVKLFRRPAAAARPKTMREVLANLAIDQLEEISDLAALEIRRKLILWHQQETQRKPKRKRKPRLSIVKTMAVQS